MYRLPNPSVIFKLASIRVVLEYSFFAGAQPDRQSRLMAIDAHLSGAGSPRQWHLPDDAVAALEAIADHPLSREAFLGDWCDPRDLMLIEPGWGLSFDRFNASGQYAYAFSRPPYGLWGPQAKIQRLFELSTERLLGRFAPVEIFDWSSDTLDKVHPLFAAGLEWWGVFLFTVYNPEEQSLVVISGSSTD